MDCVYVFENSIQKLKGEEVYTLSTPLGTIRPQIIIYNVLIGMYFFPITFSP